MVTFEQARAAVLLRARQRWNPGMGTLVAAPTGFESDRYWRVRAVAREELDGDTSFLQADEIVYLVDKQSGHVTETSYLLDPDLVDEMAPYPAA